MSESYQIRDQNAVHFLTFQVVGWADIFTRKCYRDILIESFNYCRTHKNLKLHAYVIMSNHVHCILSSENNLSDVVRDYKKYTSKAILKAIKEQPESRREWLMMIFEYHAKFNKRNKDIQFWTHENHAVELSSNEMIESRIDYIHQNPVRAGIVEFEHEYLYSSARNPTWRANFSRALNTAICKSINGRWFNSGNRAKFCLRFEITVVDAGYSTRWKKTRQSWGVNGNSHALCYR